MLVINVFGKYLHDSYMYRPSSVGVICFTIDPSNQNVYLILGKESDFSQLADGDSGCWCDFGGKPLNGELLVDTAAREFTEESLGVISFTFGRKPHYTEYADSFKECLENGDYVMCLRFFWGTVLRVYFLKEVPWQPEVAEKFDRTRDALLRIITTGKCPFGMRNYPGISFGPNQRPQIDGTYLEKFKVQCWSLDRLNYVVNHYGRFRQQRFRSSFVPVLKFLIRYFKKYYI